MKWGIYARNGFEGASAFRDGILEIGQQARISSVNDYTSGQIEGFDVVVVFGLQWRGAWVLRDYKTAGIPVVVVDYGYCKRTNHIFDWKSGHWQVSLDGLNNIPMGDFPSDRWDTLGIEIKERGGDPDGYTLVCTQTTGDASHGHDEKGIQQWVNEQFQKWPNPILRPHPLQEHLTYGKPTMAGSLKSALEGASRVVTMNSNTGHEALIAGVQVTATMPAAYSELTGPLPSMETRLKYFHRLAYGQWTWDEMRRGIPQTFLMPYLIK